MTEIESERKKEKNKIATLHNLLRDFNERVNSKKLEVDQSANATLLETTQSMVSQMLSEVPQVSSIEEKFEDIDQKIEELTMKCQAGSTNIGMNGSEGSSNIEVSDCTL